MSRYSVLAAAVLWSFGAYTGGQGSAESGAGWTFDTRAVCGDGAIETGEECDDGNTEAGDGCSSSCTVEVGHACIGEPSACGLDCNENDLPDECDLDCAALDSACEVADCGLSEDCNYDGRPDECGVIDDPPWDCLSFPVPLNSNAASDSGDDGAPQLTTNGQGDWLAVWPSNNDLGGTIGTDYDLLVARSTDNGASWTEPAPLNTNAASDPGTADDYLPQLATDGQGHWLAVWVLWDWLGGPFGYDWDIFYSASTDNGASWTDPAPLNSNAATDRGWDESPHLATDGQGNWLCVWDSEDKDGGALDWDADILFSRSTDNGASWTAQAPLNNNAASDDLAWDYAPRLTTDGQGTWLAVWRYVDGNGETLGDDHDILFSLSTDIGASWTDPAPLNTNAAFDSGHDYVSQPAADGQGNWLVLWDSNDDLGGTIGTDYDVLVARSTDDGVSWTDPAPLNTNAASDSGYDNDPHLTTDGQGNWLAVWTSSDDLGGVIGADRDILYAVSNDNGASWTAPAPFNTNAASDSGYDYDPHLAIDGQGNWLVVWDSADDFGEAIGTDFDILFSRLRTVDEDCNCNGTPDACDIAYCTAGEPTCADCNHNGVPDQCDLDDGTSQDCQPNDIPDECEEDCNDNGIPDSCDLIEGTSYDCQPNGIPDECEEDCNDNDIPDSCDLDEGTSQDCQPNDIPDECEIDKRSTAPGDPFFCNPAAAPGGLDECDPDCNDTGIPDDCELAGNDCNSDGRPDECGVVDACLFDFMTFPAPLNTNAASDNGNEGLPQLTTDGQGNWLAVWVSHDDLGGTIGTDGDILFSLSTNNGASWTAPAPLNTNAASDSGRDGCPQVTTDGQGQWLAVWPSADDLEGTIGTDYDILFSASTDNGANWTPPAPLNTNAASDSGGEWAPQLTTDRHGNWLAVWYSYDDLGGTIGTDEDILLSRSTDNGANWTAPVPLNINAAVDSGEDWDPQLTTDGQGNWLAVWYSLDDLFESIGPDSDILFSHSTNNGASWTFPEPLNSHAASDYGMDRYPQLTTDGQGNWLAVWWSTDDLGGTIGTDHDILFSASTDNGMSWTDATPLNTNAASDSGTDLDPQLTTDGQGHWLAVWRSSDDLAGTVGGDWDILFSASTDNGASWTSPEPLNSNAASDWGDDNDPQLTTDGRDNWLAAWSSEDNLGGTIGPDSDILFSRIRSVGEDCNCNGLPDACDIADCAGDPWCGDCNSNEVPDECDIDEGTSEDCQPNGVPDECDVDSDGDGVPDACDPCPNDYSDDSDGDGVCDANDECPRDANKIEPGICGCGVDDDADSDGDGIPDCVDTCPGADDEEFGPCDAGAIPTVSEWGLLVLALLLLVAGKICFSTRTAKHTR
ncbi:MAG: exo-alpha-sialidase [Phycisphaerales bacterium]|nr:MAG: exo-alpha-sialidase [Phycisphaerales bacterium]